MNKLISLVCLLTCIPHLTNCSEEKTSNCNYSPLNKKSNESPQQSYDAISQLKTIIDSNNLKDLSPTDLVIEQQQRALRDSGEDFSDDENLELEETTINCPTHNFSYFLALCCLCFRSRE